MRRNAMAQTVSEFVLQRLKSWGVRRIFGPKDVQELSYETPAHKHGTVHTSIGFHSPRVIPHDQGLRRAADVLNGGQRVGMLVGQGAAGCDDEIAKVADLLGCGVAKA